MSTTLTPTPTPAPSAPRLLDGVEFIGQPEGSGLRDAPYLVRRPDGEMVLVARLLYLVAEEVDGRRTPAEIAERVSREFGRPVSAGNVAYLIEQKLRPLGLLLGADGAAPKLERLHPLLALRFRVPLVPVGIVRGVARVLSPLFAAPIVVAIVASLVAFDVWLAAIHGPTGSVNAVIAQPALMLGLLGIAIVSMLLHEFGHAAACRYGGAQPGAIGAGVYIVWPVFYCDVTDSYRLDRRGRLRTDLGGVYLNAIVAIIAACAYAATGSEWLLLVVVTEQLVILDQFMPWIRLDGYYIVSDLIGVSNLFARIKPILRSLLPGRAPDPRVTELKPWARAAVTVWVVTTVLAVLGLLTYIVLNVHGFLSRAGDSLLAQIDLLSAGLQSGDPLAVLSGALGAVMLTLAPLGLTLTYLLLCRRTGARLAVRGAQRRAKHLMAERGAK